jgi:hypothetical protein
MDIGVIPIADKFPSGAMQPLNHPGCRHTALYRRMKTPKVVKPKVNEGEKLRAILIEENENGKDAKRYKAAQEKYDAIIVERDNLFSAFANETKRIANANGVDEETARAILRKEMPELASQLGPMMDRADKALKQVNRLYKQKQESLRKTLYAPNRSLVGSTRTTADPFSLQMRGNNTAELSATLRKTAEAGIEEFSRFVDKSVFDNVELKMKFFSFEQIEGRAYFKPKRNRIFLDKTDGVDIVLHEMGHMLEDIHPDIRKKVHDFYEMRTANSPLTHMGSSFDADEFTRVDDFWDSYMGKEYVNSDGERFATEILSIGLEMMYTDPVRLANADPEYFDFIVNLLRGN